MRRGLRSAATVILLALGVVGAGPPREGLEIDASAGYGEYKFTTGCGEAHYRYRVEEVPLHLGVRARSGPWAGAAEVGQSRGRIASATLIPPDPTGGPPLKQRNLTLAALRGGYHGRFGGLELGGGVFIDSKEKEKQPSLVPSGTAWLGVEDIAYVWANFLAGSWTGQSIPVGLGIGHSGKLGHVEAGVLGESLMLDATALINDSFSLGAGGRYSVGEEPGWNAVLHLTFWTDPWGSVKE